MATRSATSARPLAVFDFDGTLTVRDSLLPFLFGAQSRVRLGRAALLSAPDLLALAVRLRRREDVKERIFVHLFEGMPVDEFERRAVSFALGQVPALLRPRAVERLRWHQRHGHQTVIASASLEAYLRPWARLERVDAVVGTRLEVRGGRVTGRLDGPNCSGVEKVRRITERLGPLEGRELYVYGDSEGDRALLAVATHAAYRPFR